MHSSQEVVGLWTIWSEGYHKFQLFGCLLESAENGVHEGVFVHCLSFGIASVIPGRSACLEVAIQIGEFLLLQLLLKILAFLYLVFNHDF